MKVIGKSKEGYICEIGHTELEMFLNQYYGKLARLDVGKEIDLGKGYDFYHETKRLLGTMGDLVKQNKKFLDTLNEGLMMFVLKENKDDQPKTPA